MCEKERERKKVALPISGAKEGCGDKMVVVWYYNASLAHRNGVIVLK